MPISPTLPEGVTPLAPVGPDRTVDLWSLDLTTPIDEALLDTHDRDALAALAHPVARRRLAAGRTLLRHVLADTFGTDAASLTIDRRCVRCGRQHGRPRLTGHDPRRVHLSTSRAADRGLVAVSHSGLVGVDLEVVRPIRGADRQARHALPILQAAAVASAAPADQSLVLITAWSRQEALIKAAGGGVPGGLRRFEVVEHHDPTRRVTDRAEVGTIGWWLEDLRVGPGWVAAVAAQVRSKRPIQCQPPQAPRRAPGDEHG